MKLQEEWLIDKKGLLELCPVLTRWRLEWLIRSRQIPFVRIGKKRIYFAPDEIMAWINSNKIEPLEVDNDKQI